MKRLVKPLSFVLAMCLTAGGLLSCRSPLTSNSTTQANPASPAYMEAASGLSPSQVYEVLCNVKDVLIEIESDHPQWDPYTRTISKAEESVGIVTNYYQMNDGKPYSYHGETYYDLKNRKTYAHDATMRWTVYDMNPSTNWKNILSEHLLAMDWIFGSEDPQFVFRDESFELQDNAYVATTLPDGIKALKMTNSGIVYAFRFTLENPDGQFDALVRIRFDRTPAVKFPENASPPIVEEEDAVPAPDGPSKLHQLVPENWTEASPHPLPSTPPDNGADDLSPQEFFYALQTDEHQKIELSYQSDDTLARIWIVRDGSNLCVQLLDSAGFVLDTLYFDTEQGYKYYQLNGSWYSEKLKSPFTWDILLTLIDELINHFMQYKDSQYEISEVGQYSIPDSQTAQLGVDWATFSYLEAEDAYLFGLSYRGYTDYTHLQVWLNCNESVNLPEEIV